MRACSRCVAGSSSVCEDACGTGKEIRRVSDVPVQPAKAAARATSSARLANPDLSVPIPAIRILLDAFDLLRGHDINDRGRHAIRPNRALELDAPPTPSGRCPLRRILADDA